MDVCNVYNVDVGWMSAMCIMLMLDVAVSSIYTSLVLRWVANEKYYDFAVIKVNKSAYIASWCSS